MSSLRPTDTTVFLCFFGCIPACFGSGLLNSYTLEASFAGASVGELTGMQFTPLHFQVSVSAMVPVAELHLH